MIRVAYDGRDTTLGIFANIDIRGGNGWGAGTGVGSGRFTTYGYSKGAGRGCPGNSDGDGRGIPYSSELDHTGE